jgi:hypothetical protein
MSSIIRATTTSGLQIAPDNSGSLVLQTNGTTTALTIDTSQNATFAGTLTATGKLVSSSMPTGSVLQVVSTTKTDTFSMSSTTFSDVTGLSVSITPSNASNKILVISSLNWGSSANDINTTRLLRDSTVISAGATASNRSLGFAGMRTASADNIETVSVTFLDSPATTSSVTYKIQVRIGSGDTIYVNRTATDTDVSAFPRLVSSITVMEIKG